MPTYDFYCEDDGIIEIEKPMNDPNPEACPKCDKPIRRFFSPIKAVYKGIGFSTTDQKDVPGMPDVYDRAVIDKEFD